MSAIAIRVEPYPIYNNPTETIGEMVDLTAKTGVNVIAKFDSLQLVVSPDDTLKSASKKYRTALADLRRFRLD